LSVSPRSGIWFTDIGADSLGYVAANRDLYRIALAAETFTGGTLFTGGLVAAGGELVFAANGLRSIERTSLCECGSIDCEGVCAPEQTPTQIEIATATPTNDPEPTATMSPVPPIPSATMPPAPPPASATVVSAVPTATNVIDAVTSSGESGCQIGASGGGGWIWLATGLALLRGRSWQHRRRAAKRRRALPPSADGFTFGQRWFPR
jgi:hypothetical protein